jgi:hypothetical protein
MRLLMDFVLISVSASPVLALNWERQGSAEMAARALRALPCS